MEGAAKVAAPFSRVQVSQRGIVTSVRERVCADVHTVTTVTVHVQRPADRRRGSHNGTRRQQTVFQGPTGGTVFEIPSTPGQFQPSDGRCADEIGRLSQLASHGVLRLLVKQSGAGAGRRHGGGPRPGEACRGRWRIPTRSPAGGGR